MFNNVKTFVRKHNRELIFGAGMVVGVVVMHRYELMKLPGHILLDISPDKIQRMTAGTLGGVIFESPAGTFVTIMPKGEVLETIMATAIPS